MKKISYLLSIVGLGIFAQAQEVTETKSNDDYNKWSIEANGGATKARKALTPGYYSETPSFYHADFGVRYMFNPKFGLKLDGGYDRIKEGEGIERFRSNYYRVDLQGVVNLGRVLNFETWTSRIGLLAHGGAGYSWMNNEGTKGADGKLFDDNDNMVNVMAGLTPQLRLTDRLVLTGDLSYVRNIRQQITFDGKSDNNNRSGFGGELWNATLGLTFYLGKNEKHADWVYEPKRSDLEDRIANIEEMLKDTDGDGVADYLDQEPNSAPGAVVDTKGVTIDHNGNGIPDNIEEYIKQNAQNNSTVVNDADFLEQMINSGIINVYFDYNSDKPYQQSVGGIKFVSEYLKSKPEAQIEILGYADPVGGAAFNKDLSRRRAENVKALLVSQGASASQLTAIGEGEDAEFKKSQVSSHQLARRVVFRVK